MNKFALALLLTPASLTWAQFTLPSGPWLALPNSVVISGEKIVDTDVSTPGNQTSYWNNNTDDGSTCRNVGCFVTNVGSPANSPNWQGAAYLANNDGSAISNISFQGTASAPNPTLLAEIAGWAPRNWIGWYDSSKSIASLTTSDFGVIFKGSNTVGDTVAFSPAGTFGFWLLPNYGDSSQDGQSAGTVLAALKSSGRFSESSKSTGGGQQQFAVFVENIGKVVPSQTSPFVALIGVEDTNLPGGDQDYNDAIFKVTLVPEPGFYGALSLGLTGLVFAVRRRRASRS
ncbi:MAG: DUF4114 domain-containing protein [Acidobacteria bacterium]|nr:DUF4114 domain-containing protein [Acidobacteriota bacterium]